MANNTFMKNLMKSFGEIGLLFASVGLVLLTAYLLSILLLYLGQEVVPSLGLGNNTSNLSSIAGIVFGYTVNGVTGLLAIAGITSIAAGIGILAVLVSMFGMNFMDRFNISVKNLATLLTQVAIIAGLYTAAIFVIVLLRILFGILGEIVAPALNLDDTSGLVLLDTLIGTVFDVLFSILTVSVGLLTLAFVAGAFGFQVTIFGKDVSKIGRKKKNKFMS